MFMPLSRKPSVSLKLQKLNPRKTLHWISLSAWVYARMQMDFFVHTLEIFAVVNNTGLHTAYQYELLLWYIMDYSITVKPAQ